MKKIIMLLVLACAVLMSHAQDEKNNEIKTLFSDRQSLGFYGSVGLGYSRISEKDALVAGGRLAMIFNHSMAIGLAGYGFVNGIDDYPWQDEINLNYSLAGGYGGIFIEPVIGGLNPVHVTFPVILGLGGISQVRNYWPGSWEFDYYDTPIEDLFFIVEPAVELEFNLARFFRTAVVAGYRFTSDIELFGMAPDALRGFHFGMAFKFGKF